MKKILLTFSLLVMLIAMSCDTSKSSVATSAATPVPQKPAAPQKSVATEADMQTPTTQSYKKKALSPRGGLQPMEAVSTPDTLVPRN